MSATVRVYFYVVAGFMLYSAHINRYLKYKPLSSQPEIPGEECSYPAACISKPPSGQSSIWLGDVGTTSGIASDHCHLGSGWGGGASWWGGEEQERAGQGWQAWHSQVPFWLADFPAVFVHICNFDICHENLNNKSQLSRAFKYLLIYVFVFVFVFERPDTRRYLIDSLFLFVFVFERPDTRR